MISRLTAQKGFDILIQSLPKLLERGAQAVILGAGQEEVVRALREIAARHEGRMALRIGFDEGLAHRIEAGADMFLMPSRYEPCGLNQMYSLRYGTVPVVRATGGLADTVNEGNGFVFENYSAADLLEAGHAALDAYADKTRWRDLMQRGMAQDFSWGASARRYLELYRRIFP
jgi:starch synthase